MYGITDNRIDGRGIYPIKKDGNIQEMMIVAQNCSYSDTIDTFIKSIKNNGSTEIVGYAENRNEAIKLTEKHYKSNY